jgi:DNA-binding response OmpR family regulator
VELLAGALEIRLMDLLLVDDNESLCKLLKAFFQSAGIRCDVANDGLAGFDKATSAFYDVIILDIALPDKSGIALLADLRAAKNNSPVLMLTARDGYDYKEAAFERGADDYLVKPFLHKELLLRVRALARRPLGILESSCLEVGAVRLNTVNMQIEMSGKPVAVSAKEAKLLCFLFKNKGRFVSKEMILNAIWGIYKPIQSNNVEVYIHMIRKDFPKKLSGFEIVTKHTLGYMALEDDGNV